MTKAKAAAPSNKKSKAEDLDDLIAGEKAAGKTKKVEPTLEQVQAEAAEKVDAAIADAGQEPVNDEPEQAAAAEVGEFETFDVTVGVYRFPEGYGYKQCMTCKNQYMAPKTWKAKRCPPCFNEAEGIKPTEQPAEITAPTPESAAEIQIPLNPLEQLAALIEAEGSIIERVLASANYASVFGLHGGVVLEINNGKIIGTSTFSEDLADFPGVTPNKAEGV